MRLTGVGRAEQGEHIAMTMIAPARNWQRLGDITIVGDSPQLSPKILRYPTSTSGIYRLNFKKDDYLYVGKSKDLRRRLGEYCKPTLGTEQEHVLRLILMETGGATVEVVPESELQEERHAAEKDEQQSAKASRLRLLNRGGLGYSFYLKCKGEYHKRMLA